MTQHLFMYIDTAYISTKDQTENTRGILALNPAIPRAFHNVFCYCFLRTGWPHIIFFFSLSSKGSEAIHFSSTMSKKVPTRTNEHLHHTVLDVQHEVSDEKLVTGIQYSDYASTV